MWIKSSGTISENVMQVTTPVSSHYVICGEEIAFVDSGVTAVFETIISQLESVYADGGGLEYLLISHAHFDHIGGIPLFREKSPTTKIVASSATAEILTDKKYLKEAWSWNKKLCEAMKCKMPITQKRWLECFEVDQVLGDGDSVDLGEGISVKAITLPGHSHDCMGYFVLPDSVLQAGEAVGGYHGRELVSCSFGDSYASFLESIDKLLSLDIRGIGLPHAGSLGGDLARNHLISVRAEAERFFAEVSERLAQGELVDEIVESVNVEWVTEGRVPEGPFSSSQLKLVTGMIEAIVASSGKVAEE